MLAFDAMRSPDSSTRPPANQIAVKVSDAHQPAAVRNCSRLGRSATRPASPSVTGYAIGVAAESRLINA